MELENASQLGAAFSMDGKKVTELLATSNVKPVHESKVGGGIMRLYDSGSARAALQKFLDDVAAEAAKLRGNTAVTFPQADAMLQSLDRIEVQGLAEVERCHDGFTKLIDQNALLLRALNDLKGAVLAKVDALQETFDRRLDELEAASAPMMSGDPQAAVKLIAAIAKPKPAPKVRVGIVGLYAAQKATIEKEFGNVFDLMLIESEEAHHASINAKLCSLHTLFGMMNITTKTVDAAAKKAGVRYVRIHSSSISALRSALTDLFVKVSDEQKAAA
jgi:hypothetical protein